MKPISFTMLAATAVMTFTTVAVADPPRRTRDPAYEARREVAKTEQKALASPSDKKPESDERADRDEPAAKEKPRKR